MFNNWHNVNKLINHEGFGKTLGELKHCSTYFEIKVMCKHKEYSMN